MAPQAEAEVQAAAVREEEARMEQERIRTRAMHAEAAAQLVVSEEVSRAMVEAEPSGEAERSLRETLTPYERDFVLKQRVAECLSQLLHTVVHPAWTESYLTLCAHRPSSMPSS
jgi:hypothetical protein